MHVAALGQRAIVGCWIVFAGYWLMAAWSVKPTQERQRWAERMLYQVPMALGAALLFGAKRIPVLGALVVPNVPAAEAVGVAVCLVGLAVAIWARRALGANWSGIVELKAEHELVERGPYRFVRHPIYSGLLLMALGSAFAIGRAACFLGLVVLAAGVWVKLQQEEALLMRHFGERYAEYRRCVTALVPNLL